MAKQTKSTQESAKPKKPLLNWGKREKVVSSVKDSIAPDGSSISYTKKTVTAPASILGGGAMKKEEKNIHRSKKNEDGVYTSWQGGSSKSKSKEGQKSKSTVGSFVAKRYDYPSDSTSKEYISDKNVVKRFRKPTKLLKGVDYNSKDSSLRMETTRYENQDLKFKNLKDWDRESLGGRSQTSKKTLALPKNTEKNMKDSFDNMKSSPEYVVKRSKKTDNPSFY